MLRKHAAFFSAHTHTFAPPHVTDVNRCTCPSRLCKRKQTGKEIKSAAQDYGMNDTRRSDTYHPLSHVCEGLNQSIICEQHSSFSLTLYLLYLWAKGSNFTQLLAALGNSLSGLLAFGSFSLNGLEDTTLTYHS